MRKLRLQPSSVRDGRHPQSEAHNGGAHGRRPCLDAGRAAGWHAVLGAAATAARLSPQEEPRMPDSPIAIPARKGKAAFVAKGQTIRVINTHGEQVVDTWAFNRADLTEFMSMEHSRAGMQRLIPQARRRAADQSPPADPDGAGGHLRRHPRHADGGLRHLSLPGVRHHPLPRQLHRQPGAGDARPRPDPAGDAEPAQPVHEHPLDDRGRAGFRPAGLHRRAATSRCGRRWTW